MLSKLDFGERFSGKKITMSYRVWLQNHMLMNLVQIHKDMGQVLMIILIGLVIQF